MLKFDQVRLVSILVVISTVTVLWFALFGFEANAKLPSGSGTSKQADKIVPDQAKTSTEPRRKGAAVEPANSIRVADSGGARGRFAQTLWAV